MSGSDPDRREIERRFLVRPEAWQASSPGTRFRQGYLSTDPDRTVRVRLEGEVGKLTVKGRKVGATAPEFEYTIPAPDAQALLERICVRPVIEKIRHAVEGPDGHEWCIDVFEAENAGLILAEIELADEDEGFARPDWLGAEITEDFRYSNARLTERPYRSWSPDERKAR